MLPRDRIPGPRWVSPSWAFLVLFLLGLTVRGCYLALIPEQYLEPHTQWEQESIAVSLAQSGRFADPYALPTGPTAHLPPLVPGMLGLVYKVLGLNSTAGYVGWGIRFASQAATWAALPWIAARLGVGLFAGIVAGLAGALLPQSPGHGEGLTGLALALLLVAFVDRWRSDRTSAIRSLLLGASFGVAFHVQPALLPVLLGALVFELLWVGPRERLPEVRVSTRPRGSRVGRRRVQALIVLVGAFLVCIPWGVRNYLTFGEVFFIRSNFGLELRVGNHEGADADIDVSVARGTVLHPRSQPSEARKVRDLGEVIYMRAAGKEATDWIQGHPMAFLRLTLQRIVYFWLGPVGRAKIALAISGLSLLAALGAVWTIPRLDPPARAAVLVPLAAFPLVYYVVAYMPRYRIPIDWILFLLAGAAIARMLGLGTRETRGAEERSESTTGWKSYR